MCSLFSIIEFFCVLAYNLYALCQRLCKSVSPTIMTGICCVTSKQRSISEGYSDAFLRSMSFQEVVLLASLSSKTRTA